MDPSVSPRDMACPSSERGLGKDIVDDCVKMGEAAMDGRGRKPHVATFRGLISYILAGQLDFEQLLLVELSLWVFILRERRDEGGGSL